MSSSSSSSSSGMEDIPSSSSWAESLRATPGVTTQTPLPTASSNWGRVFEELNVKFKRRRVALGKKSLSETHRRERLEEAVATQALPADITAAMKKLFPYPQFPKGTPELRKVAEKKKIDDDRLASGLEIAKRRLRSIQERENTVKSEIKELTAWAKNEGATIAELHVPQPTSASKREFISMWKSYFQLPHPAVSEKDNEALEKFHQLASTLTFAEANEAAESMLQAASRSYLAKKQARNKREQQKEEKESSKEEYLASLSSEDRFNQKVREEVEAVLRKERSQRNSKGKQKQKRKRKQKQKQKQNNPAPKKQQKQTQKKQKQKQKQSGNGNRRNPPGVKHRG